MDGIPTLNGKSMSEKKRLFRENYDYIRTTLMQEPRGNSGVVAVVVPPSQPEADLGLIFGDYRGYVDMCIHGTIGVVTTLIECGLVKKELIESGRIVFDTPAGLVRTQARMRNSDQGRVVEAVSVSSVPSFFVENVKLNLRDGRSVMASIAFGGNFYAYVNSKELEVRLVPSNIRKILEIARELLGELRNVNVSHPEISSIKGVTGVSLFENTDQLHARNIMIAENDLFDRSPCGTGTCGRMAVLHATGNLSRGEEFMNQSIIGSEFVGKIKDVTKVGGYSAISPEITGSAYLTGVADLVVSKEDKLGAGFIIG